MPQAKKGGCFKTRIGDKGVGERIPDRYAAQEQLSPQILVDVVIEAVRETVSDRRELRKERNRVSDHQEEEGSGQTAV